MAASCSSSPVSCCSGSLHPRLCIRTHPIPGNLSRFCRRRRWLLLSCAASQHPIDGSEDRSNTVFGRSYTASSASSAAVGFKTAIPRLRTASIPRQNTAFQANNSTASSAAAAPSDSTVRSDAEDLPDTILMVEEEEEEDGIASRVSYNWEDQWYPLYLTREVPRDAPLALQVFDKQLVLHYDGRGILRCYEDRCPHRLAKLSEGQVIDGRLECLYHGWQFEGEGQCVKIPQLPESAKIPAAACVRSYEVRDVQGVVWAWMGGRDKSRKADAEQIPRFAQLDEPGNVDMSSIHALPYDYSILLENLMDPAHIPISHDRTDPSARREDAQPLWFEITERTPRGFAGNWGRSRQRQQQQQNSASATSAAAFTRFQAPCVLSNASTFAAKDGRRMRSLGIFLCCPVGLGKSLLILRFCAAPEPPSKSPAVPFFPRWLIHQVQNRVFEQDMGFLASQNEALMERRVATRELYLNLSTSDVFVMEFRRWLDRAGPGMPYYFGHRTLALLPQEAVTEAAPAGIVAAVASSMKPAKGATALASGLPFLADPTNRYFRHVVHCTVCRGALRNLLLVRRLSIALALVSGAAAVALQSLPSRLRFYAILASVLCLLASVACKLGVNMLTTNTVRPHRQ